MAIFQIVIFLEQDEFVSEIVGSCGSKKGIVRHIEKI
jgi:hypothetical protein